MDALHKRLITSKHARPLVFLFAGPPGHGKTRLAKHFGRFFNAPDRVDTLVHRVSTTKPTENAVIPNPAWRHRARLETNPNYRVPEDGASLIYFLYQNSGKRSVVILDDVRGINDGVYDTIMQVFDQGTCMLRRRTTLLKTWLQRSTA
jgi:replication-associated recombination protein RarA